MNFMGGPPERSETREARPPGVRLPLHPEFVGTVVWGAWVVCLALGIWFTTHYSRDVPWGEEEWKVVPVLVGQASLGETLWAQSGEHRNILPKLIQVALFKLTHDFRASPIFHTLVLGLLAALLIRGVRRLRGVASYADLFFPAALLNWAQLVNRRSGVRLMFPLGALFFMGGALAILSLAARWRRRTLLVLCACVLALPLCGVNGILLAAPLAVWLSVWGVSRWRRASDSAARQDGALLLAVGAVTLALCVVIFGGIAPVPSWEGPSGLVSSLEMATRFTTLGWGQLAIFSWPSSGWITVGFALATAALLLWRTLRCRPEERPEASGLLTALAAFAVLAIGMGLGRSGHGVETGHNPRYGPQAVAFLCLSYLLWMRYGPALARRLVPAVLAAILCAGFAFNSSSARDNLAEGQAQDREMFQKDVWEGASDRELAVAHVENTHLAISDPAAFARLIEVARSARLPPFNLSAPDIEQRIAPIYERLYAMHPTRPTLVRSSRRVVSRSCHGAEVLLVHPPGEMRYVVPRGVHILSGRFGVCEAVGKAPRALEVWFRVIRRAPDGRDAVLFERLLRPAAGAGDRGPQPLRLVLPARAEAQMLLLRTEARVDVSSAGVFWTGIELKPVGPGDT